jgi:hypothetical protein
VLGYLSTDEAVNTHAGYPLYAGAYAAVLHLAAWRYMSGRPAWYCTPCPSSSTTNKSTVSNLQPASYDAIKTYENGRPYETRVKT